MKSFRGVTLEKIADPGNMAKARYFAGQRKEKRASVKSFGDEEIKDLIKDVLCMTYHPRKSHDFDRKDRTTGKIRHIISPAFRDQVLHHAIVQVLENSFTSYFHPHSLASLKNRGIEKGRKLVKKWSHTGKRLWVYQADIRKYYDNIDQATLRRKLEKKIPDRRVVELIMRSLGLEQGLGRGSYLSQWLANYFLTDFLHAAARRFRLYRLMIYMDNMTFLARSQRTLERLKAWSVRYLRDEGLEIKLKGQEAAQIYRWEDKRLDAVGYTTARDGFQRLRGHIYLSITRMMLRIEKNGSASRTQARSLLSRFGFVKHSSCRKLEIEMRNFIQIYDLKKVAKAA